MRPALLLVCCLLLPAAAAAQRRPPTCDAAQADLEKFLGTFSRSCQRDSDCEGYYYRANACAAAVVVRRHKLAGKREQRLLALQQSVREACNVYYRTRPACSPIPFRAACRRHACVDTLGAPEGEPPAKPPAEYPFATIRHACAPWDGPALQITLTKVANPGKNDARLFLTLYRDLPQPPLSKPRTFELERMESGDAVRCPRPNACESAERGRVTLEKFEGTGAQGSYELQFKGGAIERGRFKASWIEVREACG